MGRDTYMYIRRVGTLHFWARYGVPFFLSFADNYTSELPYIQPASIGSISRH